MTLRLKHAAAGGLALALVASPTAFVSSYQAEVLRIVDADTLKMRVMIWPGWRQEIAIRLAGIDTPEKRRPDRKCSDGGVAEKAHAFKAAALVADLVQVGDVLEIRNVSLGKYAGRAIADVVLTGGNSLAEILWLQGFAVRYDGGRRPSWCIILGLERVG